MRRHAKASSATSIRANDSRRARIGLACLAVLSLMAFAGIDAPSAGAVDTCPNAVFRTGPSAKLPDCRAYELVSPSYTGSVPPTGRGPLVAGLMPSMFAMSPITSFGDSVVFNTAGGGLSGFPATGYLDRYRARRTADGWKTEAISPGADQMAVEQGGGVSADHEYSVHETEEPSAKLWPAFAGKPSAVMLRTPTGYEPLARGSLGDFPIAKAEWITPGATHVIFTTGTFPSPPGSRLEPEAPSGAETIYDRTPGGPTHVVSLLPGGVTPSENSHYLGATKDGTEVAYEVGGIGSTNPIYVRRDNSITKEVVRPGGIVVGKELTCTGGPGSATLEYQWLDDGDEIAGATSSTYTTTAADEGSLVQCRVTASNSEGTSISASATRVVEPYQQGSFPPETSGFASVSAGITSATVGTQLTCSNASFAGSPTLSYQWLSDGDEIAGATSSTYTPLEADVGHSLQCRVTASNADGTAVAYSYNPVSIYKPAPTTTVNPTISNATSPGDLTPAVGDELSCSEGTWNGSPSFAYAWLRNGNEIGGATSATYTTTVADEEKVLQCLVTATSSGGSTEAASEEAVVDPQPATAPPKQTFPSGAFGTARVGNTLFCGAGGWEGEPSFSYQWLRNGNPIGGATESSYTLTVADLGAVVQCLVSATNASGSAVGIDAGEGAKVVTRAVPAVTALLPTPGFTFDGIFSGRVFYADVKTQYGSKYWSDFGDLYMYDLDTEKTTRITTTGDASIVNISEDGSHVYYVSKSPIGGEGEAGKPNLGVWIPATESSKYIATVAEADVTSSGRNGTPSLNTWAKAISDDTSFDRGRAMSHTRSIPDGTVFAFESTAQLTSFDNTEASAEDCGAGDNEGNPIPGQPCDEVYRYDTASEGLTCISCGQGLGPATGEGRLESIDFSAGSPEGVEPAGVHATVEGLTVDGDTLVFESTEGLVPQDGNETKDVYRWKRGEGVALISTGQDSDESAVYGVTPNGADIVYGTLEKLLPQDENGSTMRLYDARVNGGFPPPEEAVTERCSGDACQGQASAALEAPNVASAALNGGGNVPSRLKCARNKHRVSRNGKERCAGRKHHRRRAHHKRRAAR